MVLPGQPISMDHGTDEGNLWNQRREGGKGQEQQQSNKGIHHTTKPVPQACHRDDRSKDDNKPGVRRWCGCAGMESHWWNRQVDLLVTGALSSRFLAPLQSLYWREIQKQGKRMCNIQIILDHSLTLLYESYILVFLGSSSKKRRLSSSACQCRSYQSRTVPKHVS